MATKIGYTPEKKLGQKAEIDSGSNSGVTSEHAKRLQELERENRELKRANDILRKAAAFFAQEELDCKRILTGAGLGAVQQGAAQGA